MEMLRNKITAFLQVSEKSSYSYGDGYCNGYGDGYGYGNGNGDGYGNGYGNGNGNGDGYCNGYGDGYCNGYGDGNGNGGGYGNGDGNGYCNGYGDGKGYCNGDGRGITKYNGNDVYIIDGIATIITNIKYNIAKGYTFSDNVILVPCYIVKINGYFAHGETAKEAYNDALAKYQRNQPLSERIANFIKQYPTLDTIVKHEDLFRWHNILTGSCRFGRLEFCKAHGIDPEQGTMTIKQFFDMTKDAYGGDVITELMKKYI